MARFLFLVKRTARPKVRKCHSEMA